MRKQAVLLLLAYALAACNTYKAAQGSTSSNRVVGGMKEDAKATGDTIERTAHGIGDAINKAVK